LCVRQEEFSRESNASNAAAAAAAAAGVLESTVTVIFLQYPSPRIFCESTKTFARRKISAPGGSGGIIQIEGVNYRVNRTITYARWWSESSEKEKTTARRSEGKGGEGTLATNGID